MRQLQLRFHMFVPLSSFDAVRPRPSTMANQDARNRTPIPSIDEDTLLVTATHITRNKLVNQQKYFGNYLPVYIVANRKAKWRPVTHGNFARDALSILNHKQTFGIEPAT